MVERFQGAHHWRQHGIQIAQKVTEADIIERQLCLKARCDSSDNLVHTGVREVSKGWL